jgi:hypothetical protein
MKFQYHYLTNQLSRSDPTSPEYSYQLESQFQTGFGGQGFVLGESSWITCTIYEKKIRVFYKKVLDGSEIIYYRQDCLKADIISFEFTDKDQVIKNEKGYWVKKTN